jgi:hypothetical protein
MKTLILSCVLYGFETWFLTIKEEYRYRTFQKKALRRISGNERGEFTEGWRKLQTGGFIILLLT